MAIAPPGTEESFVGPLEVSAITLVCVLGGVLIGAALSRILPEHHLNADSKETIKLGIGLIATMTALLLGLLVASSKRAYDRTDLELSQMSADVVLLDRTLAHYGPETENVRILLHRSVATVLAQIWSRNGGEAARLDPTEAGGEVVYDEIQQLSPQNGAQRQLKAQALQIAERLGQMRWLLFAQSSQSISMPFLIVLIFWLSVIFAGFGMFAPRNMTVMFFLFLAALCVSGALFLNLEMDRPFEGVMQLSSAPLQSALAHLGK